MESKPPQALFKADSGEAPPFIDNNALPILFISCSKNTDEATLVTALIARHINTIIRSGVLFLNISFKTLESVPFFAFGLPFGGEDNKDK